MQWLGKGAWGEVCRGIFDGKDVAIKFIHWNGELSELRSLQHELTILSRLDVSMGVIGKALCVLSSLLKNWFCARAIQLRNCTVS